ncbi:MAG: Gfo/Idh/MocA family oxidoreductase [Pseudomonadota bacterium]
MSAARKSKPLSVLIVGCGAIAGGYDERRPGRKKSAGIFTHAGAYRAHGGFRLAACVEPDVRRRHAFMVRWGVAQGFANLGECVEAGLAFDVASVCVPTPMHTAVLEALLGLPVGAVFAEKPLTGSLADSRRIVAAYAQAGRPLAVNYFRRSDPAMRALKRELAAGAWGRVQGAVGYYGKGLFNCGSHLIDLLAYLWAPLEARAVLGRLDDHLPGDPTLDAVLAGPGGGLVHLVATDARTFFDFELALTTEKGRLAIEEQGQRLRVRRVKPSPLFAGYRVLEAGKYRPTGVGRALVEAVGNLHRRLGRGEPLLSDGASALVAEETCAALLALAKDIPARPDRGASLKARGDSPARPSGGKP